MENVTIEAQNNKKVSKAQIAFLRSIMQANGSEKETSYAGADVSFRWRAVNGKMPNLAQKRIDEYKEECPYFIGLELPQPTIEEATAEVAAEIAETVIAEAPATKKKGKKAIEATTEVSA